MENNEEVVVTPEENEGEGKETTSNVITLTKEEYDKLQKDLGSTKRELKDFKKSKEELKETPTEKPKSDDVFLQKYERLALKQAGITHADDMELAQKTAKKWGVDVDEVLNDEDFQVKLKRQQDSRSNVEATSKVKGSGASSKGAKDSPEHWIGKENPPTPQDIPDNRLRQQIIQKMIVAKRNNKTLKFYNE